MPSPWMFSILCSASLSKHHKLMAIIFRVNLNSSLLIGSNHSKPLKISQRWHCLGISPVHQIPRKVVKTTRKASIVNRSKFVTTISSIALRAFRFYRRDAHRANLDARLAESHFGPEKKGDDKTTSFWFGDLARNALKVERRERGKRKILSCHVKTVVVGS